VLYFLFFKTRYPTKRPTN